MAPVDMDAEQRCCRRCGTCCRKGGPSLHLQDRALVESGQIPLRHLFTIRRGEPVYDNVARRVSAATEDIVKIRGRTERDPACLFHGEKGCSIYEHRPAECRILTCWDTRGIESLYDKDRLSRRDLLSQTERLVAVIDEHDRCCGYDLVLPWLDRLRCDPRDKEAREALTGLVRLDEAMRRVVAEQTGLASDLFSFVFGRPLKMVLRTTRLLKP